jgi:hypothetical protein
MQLTFYVKLMIVQPFTNPEVTLRISESSFPENM